MPVNILVSVSKHDQLVFVKKIIINKLLAIYWNWTDTMWEDNSGEASTINMHRQWDKCRLTQIQDVENLWNVAQAYNIHIDIYVSET